MAKRPKSGNIFIFDSYTISPERREFSFRYKLFLGKEEIDLEEKLLFPKAFDLSKIDHITLNNALEGVHLALGMSYWKAYCPREIRLPDYRLSKKEADFWNLLYTKGLGEFFYKNKIDFRGLVKFPFFAKATKGRPFSAKSSTKSADRSLLLFGGGKDSWVSYELLKKGGKKFDTFSLITSVSETLKNYLPKGSLIVERRLDPKLFELNDRGAYNGHVPISAIIAFVSNLVALVYGYKYVIASNERSANYGNVKYLGEDINHQWSKSFEFEKEFQEYYKKNISPSVTYFSLLRPFYEIKIAEMFSRYSKHFKGFTSCNTNFRILEDRVKFQWCNKCPKCAFVFAMLSAFLPKDELVSIFGVDLYEEKALLPTFRELLGLKKIKPFECVGTPDEVHMAFFAAYESGEYYGEPAMKMFEREALGSIKNIEKLYKELMGFSNKHAIPSSFIDLIKPEPSFSRRLKTWP